MPAAAVRLARLEALAARLPPPRAEELARRANDLVVAYARFLKVLPEARHERVFALSRVKATSPSHADWKIDNESLQALYHRRRWGAWQGAAVMLLAVCDWFLLGAGAWLTCAKCTLPLPYDSGFWHKLDGSGRSYQGALVPFLACPACGGPALDGVGRPPGPPRLWAPLPDGKSWVFKKSLYLGDGRWEHPEFPTQEQLAAIGTAEGPAGG